MGSRMLFEAVIVMAGVLVTHVGSLVGASVSKGFNETSSDPHPDPDPISSWFVPEWIQYSYYSETLSLNLFAYKI